jgi:predicted nicotinamide N-methyase
MHFSSYLQTMEVGNKPVALFVPDASEIRKAFQKGLITDPYWSQVWPSSIAIAQFIQTHPEYINDNKVLELGGGLGLPSLVAARYAREVICTDKEAAAVGMVQQSALHYGFQHLQASVLDWTNISFDINADTILLSDVNYMPALFLQLKQVIDQLLYKGKTIILSTPQRLMAKDFVQSLLVQAIRQETIAISHQSRKTMVTVLVLQTKPL